MHYLPRMFSIHADLQNTRDNNSIRLSHQQEAEAHNNQLGRKIFTYSTIRADDEVERLVKPAIVTLAVQHGATKAVEL